jgi:hypothetical protein
MNCESAERPTGLYRPNGDFIACPDAWWPDAGVATEIDSRQWHLAPDDWERTMTRHPSYAKPQTPTKRARLARASTS